MEIECQKFNFSLKKYKNLVFFKKFTNYNVSKKKFQKNYFKSRFIGIWKKN